MTDSFMLNLRPQRTGSITNIELTQQESMQKYVLLRVKITTVKLKIKIKQESLLKQKIEK